MNSFNYDHSDCMTDYYDRNFYDSIKFGNNRTPFKVETVRSHRMSSEKPKIRKTWKNALQQRIGRKKKPSKNDNRNNSMASKSRKRKIKFFQM